MKPNTILAISIFTATVFSSAVSAGVVYYMNTSLNTGGVNVNFQEQFENALENYQKKQQEAQTLEQERMVKEVESKAASLIRVEAEDHVRGSSDARIAVIEYSDFECPYCKRHHPTMLELMKQYPENVQWIYRHNPLPFHDPNATDQALASECVAREFGNEAFWTFTDALYERTTSNKGFPYENIAPLVEELGWNTSLFSSCMESKDLLPKISEDMSVVNALGGLGTPASFIIDTKTGAIRFVNGAYPLDTFKEIIDNMLTQ